jgi:tripeptide aminopeptidase
MTEVLERFLRYVQVDTQSADGVDAVPSTDKQFVLARMLYEELREMGASNVRLDEEHAYVYATIPGNLTTTNDVPAIGFIAHMDTSPAVSGAGVQPRIVKNYDGQDIPLNQEFTISVEEFPEIRNYVGQDLIVTDGSTLLGADDKAGVAEIMTMAHYLLTHGEVPHGTIQIGFTPDEEVGRGVDYFDVAGFGADFAYTVDGGALGELEYENFNALNIQVTVHGKSIHPGDAKGRMRNALLVAMEFQNMLPTFANPAYTERYEGFYHLDELHGGVDETVMSYIIRDHDAQKFNEKVKFAYQIATFLNTKYGAGTVLIQECGCYRNMKEMIEPHMELIDKASKAMEEAGVTPRVVPIRGGTDGARLSYMGLPCPNLCTGGHNYHGRFEYIPVQSLEKTAEILIRLVGQYVKQE